MKVIIIGGSATGMGVAARLRRNDPKIDITVYQDKSYVSLGACGLPYYVADEFENENLMLARTINDFEKMNIQVHSNKKVKKIDFESKKVILEDGADSYDYLTIAVGAKPIVPNIVGINTNNVFTLTTLEDGKNLKNALLNKDSIEKITIVGGGFIGLEMCETLSKIGKKVNLIEMEEELSSKSFDSEITTLIKDKLIEKEIEVFLGAQVTEILNENGNVSGVVLKNGEVIQTQAVLLCVGFKPNTEFLKDTNLKLINNGAILVNKLGETNIKDVYAGGDCATSKNFITGEDIYSPLATVASKFSRVIADNIVGKNISFEGSIQSSIIRIFDLEVARTGLTEKYAKEKNMDVKSIFIKDKDFTHYVNGQSDLYLKLIMNNKDKTIIGAQMCGSNKAVLRINALAAMIWNKTIIDKHLEQVDLVYSPPFSKTTDIIHIAISNILK